MERTAIPATTSLEPISAHFRPPNAFRYAPEAAKDPPPESGIQARAIKAATERARRWRGELSITRWRFNVALRLTVLLNMDAASAAWSLRRRKWRSAPLEPQTPREALLQQAVEHAVLAASVSYCTSWTDPDVAALGTSALRAATKASRDKRVLEWAAQRNATHGAVVTPAAVVKRCIAESAAFPAVGARLPDIGLRGGERSKIVWCYRWRRRCAGKITSLRTKEPLPLHWKRDKAGHGGAILGKFFTKN